ncbi:MAG: hypothetical protein AB7W37_13690 [Syntrophobacteraceae bacterium]
MKQSQWMKSAFAALVLLALLGLIPSPACAEEALQNTGFESYDSATMAPDSWQVLDGNASIYTEQVYDGSASVYTIGGTMTDGVDAPNTSQTGTLVQLVDLSTLSAWGSSNWLTLGLSAYFRLWGATKLYAYVEYLPASYNDKTIAADDPAWSSEDVITVLYTYKSTHARSSKPWYSFNYSDKYMPAVRWVRVRFMLDATYKSNSYFTDGPYYIALDAVSLNIQPYATPEACSAENVIANPGFESVSSGVPSGWHVLSGSMAALSSEDIPPCNGDGYVGCIGGHSVVNDVEDWTITDYPSSPQNGSLVQVVDLSTLSGWADADTVLFNFSVNWLNYCITTSGMSTAVEYLPESYNDSTVAWDDAAWSGDDVQTAFTSTFSTNDNIWQQYKTDQGSMPKVRWVRVRLNVDDGARVYSQPGGTYLGGFDDVCLTAQALTYGEPVKNPSFEEQDDSGNPPKWSRDADDGAPSLMNDGGAYDGGTWLGKYPEDSGATARVYQVIDLADKIPGWTAIDSSTGFTTQLPFIQFTLSAYVKNLGGSRVAVGLEYLPYDYNDTEGVAWNDSIWETRAWTSDGTTFTNSGGEAIDLGALIEDATVSADPTWRQKTYSSWLPGIRWIRLRIELDATASSGTTPLVGVDAISFQAACKAYGPYSGFGYLSGATYPESASAIDKPVPGWVGPEGDGVTGGYSNQSQTNYVNPVFAGFADSVANYNPSGTYIQSGFIMPGCITGQPYTDAGWSSVIVSMGDMHLDMLADYFGPAPSGTYHPGEITTVFNESPITNGPGHDFATFENGFVVGWTSAFIFGELAYVEVSTNGVDFIRMPSHSITPKWPGAYGSFRATGVFGLTGKHVNAYGNSWGTPFDLDWIADDPLVLNGTVDLTNIRYVRQVDVPGGGPTDAAGNVAGLFYDSYGNPIYDAWVTIGSGGADLDAVAVINSSAADDDDDHITNYWDNCSLTANETQFDTDEDGYGNRCDCDINGDLGGDGKVNIADYFVFRAAYGSHGPVLVSADQGADAEYSDASPNWDADADFNGDYYVDSADYTIFKERYGTTSADFH